MAQGGWQARLTSVVAAQVRRYRLEHKMSAQRLADRCEELGFAIPRPVLSNLENGRRDSITLAELLTLAAVLDVPPAALMTPLGRQELVEILPDLDVPPPDAAAWIAGEAKLTAAGSDPEAKWLDLRDGPAGIVQLYRIHGQLVDVWISRLIAAGEDKRSQHGRVPEHEELRLVRAIMREDGLIPPPLPPELAFLEPEPRP
jgi:transcriptional regulator with XRE-family HTH domain